MKIGLTYDLRDAYLAAGYNELETAEFDRIDTIVALETALHELGHTTERIGNIRQLTAMLARDQRWDLVFNIAEGLQGYGREAQVPALLDAHEIPYTFSDPLVMSLGLHKGMCKRVVRSFGIATPDFQVVTTPADVAGVVLPFPLFAKPVAEGTGKGVTAASRVDNRAGLVRICNELLVQYRQPVLVERFLPGREFTVAIVGNGVSAQCLGTAEIILKDSADADVYSYHNKEFCESLVEYRLLLEQDVSRPVNDLALAVWRSLGCRDAGRVDIRLDALGQPHFLEVNPLAGMHPEHSDLPIIATMVGIGYTQLIEKILAGAIERCTQQPDRRPLQNDLAQPMASACM